MKSSLASFALLLLPPPSKPGTFGALDGKLTAVDLKTQKAVWVFQSDTSKQNLPAIQNADGTLNFGAIISQTFVTTW